MTLKWEKVRLGDVAELQRGFDLPSTKRIEGEIPIVSSSGITGFHVEAKAKAPGVVTGRYGSIGDVFYLEQDFWPLNTSLWVKDFHGNDEKFIYFLLSNFDFKKFSDKTGVPGVNRNDLHAVNVLLPPLSEQKKIAQILSTWDKAISVTEKLLANSQRQKKALMQQLLTGKKRLLNENGVRFNGKWEKKLLSDVADVYQPKTISQSMMSDSGYPVYGANGVIGFYQEFNHETEQIAVTCRGSTCGIVNWTQAKSWITGNAMVINTDNYSYVSKKFLFYTLNGSDLKYLISGSGQPQITGNIKTHIINLPCIEEQQKIATVLSAADAEIYTLEKKLACLRDEKKALMQQLLTGKRRVKVDEAVAE
ncbi:restriction endonuclease subunit S [Enterobacter hormaechei]|uniref:restriction endonuclease subunit S n=1 Tax=Enterobacteriaceae TaxID=543 RepID=UPI00164EDD9D|nr:MULTISPECIES: restriction endonuclease subunit S [Enterobacteriaceae]EJQ5572826.1 restriction endonuclease subunit S [Escherichia coli]EKT1116570.1 restriction endonuclease subunit S [Escherichia coli]ELO4866369.1 restriction endonuclease subunit S [Escherichia coli]ELO4875156.1 restriction endonuclease subunit S [Escherichia coli]ELX1423584.1 restriction endonuclease subunit S [Escherichia coli]